MFKIIMSFKYALEGLWHCVVHERNFRIHVVAAITLSCIFPFYNFESVEFAILIFAIFIVLIAEMFNTTAERVTDLATKEISGIAKQAKDVAAGAVLMSTVCAGFIAYTLLWKIDVLTNIWGVISATPLSLILTSIYIIVCLAFILFFKKERPGK